MTEEKPKKTSQSKGKRFSFDLSDGFGKSDIFAIFGAIWSFIIGIFKIIFYPYVWIFRTFGRTYRFSRIKEAEVKALNDDERAFMESIPGFFVLTGIFLGILFSVLVYIGSDSGLMEFIDTLNLDSILEAIGAFLGFILEVILWIIGVDKKDPDTGEVILDRFGLLDLIFDIIFAGLADVITIIFDHPLMLFIGFGIIGVTIAIFWIAISETGIVSNIVSFIVKTFSFIVTVPIKIYNWLNNIYLKFNRVLSSIVISNRRLEERTVAFHRKILLLTLALGVYTFLVGVFIIITQKIEGLGEQILFVFIILFFLGFGVGIIEMWIITRFLDAVSRGKYRIGSIKAYE